MKIVKKEIINCVSIASHEILSQKRKQNLIIIIKCNIIITMSKHIVSCNRNISLIHIHSITLSLSLYLFN